MMKWKVLAMAAVGFLAAAPTWAQNYTDPVSDPAAISGRMSIVFDTRVGRIGDEAYRLGANDTYLVDLMVFNSITFKGDLVRRPWIPTGILGSTKQEGYIQFDLDTAIRNPANPSQTRQLGGWIGGMEIDGSGQYFLGAPPDGIGRLRITADAIGQVPGFVSEFGGTIQGRVPQQGGLRYLRDVATNTATKTFTRVSGGRAVTVTVVGTDPLAFRNVQLGQGPINVYPSATLNGEMNYDPEEGIWYLDLTANYPANGVNFNDHYTGTIRWLEDPNREANGKGWYEVNVRLNEQPPSAEAVAFVPTDALSLEAAFFSTDFTIPGFTGRIDYVDTYAGDSVTRSEVTYGIAANQASRIQTMNFLKIMLLGVGPLNDE